MAKKETAVEIKRIDIQRITITLTGDSALISHAWAEKAKKEMLDKQMKKAKTAKEAKNPLYDFVGSLYWLEGKPELADVTEDTIEEIIEKGVFGFPTIAFKAAAVSACSQVDGIAKTDARAVFHIDGELVKIDGKPEMREDMVRVGGMTKTADLRYRGEFPTWSTTFTIKYNAAVLSAEQIVNLFNVAGFGIGIGEWRPQKNGSYGRFHVQAETEAKPKVKAAKA